ncbi:serotonin receptor [Echinococcus multilocularis]|uniref:Serotonin receptor n=1 Tax=Echinococcus multilocularis TaxID=6211 RepID=A0A068YJ78_ECHMU|nr:serotonin receptor [Echinococcus multilocularis]
MLQLHKPSLSQSANLPVIVEPIRQIFKFSPFYTILILLVLACLILCTVFGNGLVVAVLHALLFNSHKFTNIAPQYCLAVADLMLAALVMPISALDAVSRGWFMGLSICNFWIVMDVLCFTHVDYSRRNNKKNYHRNDIFHVVCCYNYIFTDNLIAQVLKHGSCVINNDRVYTVFSAVGSFFLPMTFLLFIYIKIYASMKTCESTITLTEAATISGVPPSPVKPLVKGTVLNITQQLFSTSTDLSRYCIKSARLFNPTILVDTGNDIDDTPLPTPHRAFDLQHLSSSSPPSPLLTPSPKANGCINFNHLPCERKLKYAFDINTSCALMSVKRSHLNKDFSMAAVETVLARRERLEHRLQPFCGKVCVLPTAGGRFVLCLGYLNSLLNPIIYTVFSPDYRKAFVKILTCDNNGFRTGKQRW